MVYFIIRSTPQVTRIFGNFWSGFWLTLVNQTAILGASTCHAVALGPLCPHTPRYLVAIEICEFVTTRSGLAHTYTECSRRSCRGNGLCHQVMHVMATLTWVLAFALHSAAAGTTTTLANCQSACNLGEVICLDKNASTPLCSAIQGACMGGCYSSHVDCGCASDESIMHCAKEFALRHLSVEVFVGMIASLSALVVVLVGKRCRRIEWQRIRVPITNQRADDLLLGLESPLLLGDDYAPAPPASPPGVLPEAETRCASSV